MCLSLKRRSQELYATGKSRPIVNVRRLSRQCGPHQTKSSGFVCVSTADKLSRKSVECAWDTKTVAGPRSPLSNLSMKASASRRMISRHTSAVVLPDKNEEGQTGATCCIGLDHQTFATWAKIDAEDSPPKSAKCLSPNAFSARTDTPITCWVQQDKP